MPEISEELLQYGLMGVIGIAVATILIVILLPYINGEADQKKRVNAVGGKRPESLSRKLLGSDGGGDGRDNRRKQVQDTLQQLEQDAKAQKKRLTIKMSMMQAGLNYSIQSFWIFSAILGFGVAGIALMVGQGPLIAGAVGFAAGLGAPRWIVSIIRKKRQEKFLNEFANAIDVMVRGIKAGLPINDTLKVIATEAADPVAPEFQEICDGQKVGITVEQGFERMFERVPLPEVNFLAIVIAIQAKTGGNLGEALGNLSVVLRDRKKMKAKIRSVSQEAKSSAGIIGALPFAIMGGLYFLRPDYISILFTEELGRMMLTGCAIWMTIGVLIMRKMINFNI